MSDATRAEVIQWCKENKCDFKNPVFPPPSGWFWGQEGDELTLQPVFTITDQGEEIRAAEVEASA